MQTNPPPVAEIRFHDPPVASIDREAFEAIADAPLFDDVVRAPSTMPPLTLRNHLKSLGHWPLSRRRVRFLTGFVDRIVSLLEVRGWRVTVLGAFQEDCSPAIAVLPIELAAANGRMHALMQVPNLSRRLQVVAALRERFADVHQLVIAKNKLEAKWLAGKLSGATGEPVTWGIEPRTNYPWTHVDSVGTFEGRSVQDWTFVTFWDAELVLSCTASLQILHMFGSRRLGFLSRNEGALNEWDRAIMESVFGPVCYRPGDEHGKLTKISVAWLPAAPYPADTVESQLERKRTYFWRNARRNDLIAAAARAICEKHQRSLAGLGLDDVAVWLAGSEAGLSRVSSRPPTVTIVVENLEHAREFAQRLPDWRLACENNFTDAAPVIEGDTIVTLLLASRTTLMSDVVIFAAGSGNAWFSEMGLACSGVTAERMLVLDVDDDCDEQAAQVTQARRADYRRRGWITTTNKK